MAMNLDTRYPQAFDRLREARQSLDRFKQGKEREQLKMAAQLITEALQIDPQYLRAFYYRGMVKDLLGQPGEAASDFELVLNQRPPFLTEVKYNLGVAYFHKYGHPNLKTAISHFEDVIESTDNQALRLFARAGIAHAYAVMMIPRPDKKTESCAEAEEFFRSEKAREHVAKYHELSAEETNRALAELSGARDVMKDLRNEIKWRLCNTRAVQRMFYTDYFSESRLEKLKEAEVALIEADERSPLNWSVYCNLGSTYMRLGYWLNAEAKEPEEKKQAEDYFDQAIKRLDKVIKDLLPNYGFALYETGRVYRLRGDFDQALLFFKKAEDIKKDRAVSDETLRCERERAEKRSTDYPFLSSRSGDVQLARDSVDVSLQRDLVVKRPRWRWKK